MINDFAISQFINLIKHFNMNIRIKNRRNLEFDLADLEVLIKDYIEEQGAIVSLHTCLLILILFY